MRIIKSSIICLSLALCFKATSQSKYTPDKLLGAEFETKTFEFKDDYEGKVVSTLVRKVLPKDTTLAVKDRETILYIHGFNDYFFQAEMAQNFVDKGYNFYALDLRKYGRSILENQVQCNFKNISEYYADIDTAIKEILLETGSDSIILMGHSTGGLITSSYLVDSKTKNGVAGKGIIYANNVNKLILNSPFFEFNAGWFLRRCLLPMLIMVRSYDAIYSESEKESENVYAQSLSKKHYGEWDFDYSLKGSAMIKYGWINGIYEAQKSLRSHKNSLEIPILVLSSDKSIDVDTYSKEVQTGDVVLDVEDIQECGKELGANEGKNVTIAVIKDAMHDVILSKKEVRAEAYKTIFEWLK